MKIQQNMDVQNIFFQNQFGVNSASKSQTISKTIMLGSKKNQTANPLTKFVAKATEEKPSVSTQMRQLIRGLKQEQPAQNAYNNATNGLINDFSKVSGSPDEKEEEADNSEKYNYKTVSTKIQQAKTSLSAGQAVLAAKRETLKIKRKIASGSGDAEELQLALTHAKRMEMVARKKKHHLELEEMIRNTQKKDENADKMEAASRQISGALISAEEDKITEKEDAIFDVREEMMDAALEKIQEGEADFSEEELKELNKMISEFGEEELKELEESMEMMETMEVVDPHMSKEEFEDLKRKHRASEDKAIVKANMEYLKDMIKHELSKSTSMPGIGSNNSSPVDLFSPTQSATNSFHVPQMATATSIDIQA